MSQDESPMQDWQPIHPQPLVGGRKLTRLFTAVVALLLLIGVLGFQLSPLLVPAGNAKLPSGQFDQPGADNGQSLCDDTSTQSGETAFDTGQTTIANMQVGSEGWATAWSMYKDQQGNLWLYGSGDVYHSCGGTLSMKISRTPAGYVVDISHISPDEKYWQQDPHMVQLAAAHAFTAEPVIKLSDNNDTSPFLWSWLIVVPVLGLLLIIILLAIPKAGADRSSGNGKPGTDWQNQGDDNHQV